MDWIPTLITLPDPHTAPINYDEYYLASRLTENDQNIILSDQDLIDLAVQLIQSPSIDDIVCISNTSIEWLSSIRYKGISPTLTHHLLSPFVRFHQQAHTHQAYLERVHVAERSPLDQFLWEKLASCWYYYMGGEQPHLSSVLPLLPLPNDFLMWREEKLLWIEQMEVLMEVQRRVGEERWVEKVLITHQHWVMGPTYPLLRWIISLIVWGIVYYTPDEIIHFPILLSPLLPIHPTIYFDKRYFQSYRTPIDTLSLSTLYTYISTPNYQSFYEICHHILFSPLQAAILSSKQALQQDLQLGSPLLSHIHRIQQCILLGDPLFSQSLLQWCLPHFQNDGLHAWKEHVARGYEELGGIGKLVVEEGSWKIHCYDSMADIWSEGLSLALGECMDILCTGMLSKCYLRDLYDRKGYSRYALLRYHELYQQVERVMVYVHEVLWKQYMQRLDGCVHCKEVNELLLGFCRDFHRFYSMSTIPPK